MATYALHNGHQVLLPLAKRMAERPDVEAVLVVNIERGLHDERADEVLIQQFRDRLKYKEWPTGTRLPAVYFDPRGLLPIGSPGRAVMHAKCVVIDDEWVLVTSANLTEAAQVRNVEAGLVLADHLQALHLRAQFNHLMKNHLQEVQL